VDISVEPANGSRLEIHNEVVEAIGTTKDNEDPVEGFAIHDKEWDPILVRARSIKDDFAEFGEEFSFPWLEIDLARKKTTSTDHPELSDLRMDRGCRHWRWEINERILKNEAS
jgi:hypothetical protein